MKHSRESSWLTICKWGLRANYINNRRAKLPKNQRKSGLTSLDRNEKKLKKEKQSVPIFL